MLKTCKNVCKQCPFRKSSAPGWLGHHSLIDILEALEYEHLFSCHMQRTSDQEANMRLVENGKMDICRGFMISACKSFKLFGSHPLNGTDLRRLQDQVKSERNESWEDILSKKEFFRHHS